MVAGSGRKPAAVRKHVKQIDQTHARCNHCGATVNWVKVVRIENHLKKCKPYQDKEIEEMKSRLEEQALFRSPPNHPGPGNF